jgi:zinc protease
MTTQTRTPVAALVLALAAAGTLIASGRQPAASPQTAPLTAKLPLDAAITTGRFDNGLRYFIRRNSEPRDRAELRLAVNVGSLVEDDDQLGLAHFVEHMAFNGTEHFPKQALIAFLESTGMRFGPSINAFTSFDETVYMLQIPTDKPEILQNAFLALEDWAHNVSFDADEIDKERGVIIEEWRLRRGAGARMQDKQFPILLKGSRYAERLPIGTTEVLQNFEHDRLRKFYADWYRPDLMSVIVVGDLDTAVVQGLLQKHFASIPTATSPRPLPAFDVPKQPGTLYAIATDPEATNATVAVYSKMALRDHTTVGAYRQQIVESLFGGMLSERFSEIAQKPDAPFLGAGAARGLFVKSAEASMLQALVHEDQIDAGLQALFVEAERVARFGFTGTEFERQKTNMLRGLERMIAEKDKRPSSMLAAEYVRHVTQDEPVPGLEYEFALYQRFLPEITLAEVNSLAREWTPDGNRVVMVSAPEKSGLTIPDEATLASMIDAAAKAELEPYEDTGELAPLVESLPEPGSVTKTTTIEEIGVTEWQLSNGIRVVLKPTDFKEDEVVFRGFSHGGTSLAATDALIPAQTASQVVTLGGLGQFSNIDLGKVLTGKVASANASIGETSESIGGGGSPKDLETMFQLIHLRFTSPRSDPVMFGVMKSQFGAMMANQEATPAYAFNRALTSAMTQDHPRAQPMTVERLDELDLDASMAFYKDRFADASDFTFIFVGSFTVDGIRPLVERYLASLPSTGRSESWKDTGVRTPEGVVTREVRKGLEPQSRAAIVFTGPFTYDQAGRVAIRAMADVLQTRLRETLREELGGTYSVSVGASYDKIPREEYSVTIQFGSAPDRTEALVTRVFDEIAKLKADGPTDKQVSDVREQLLRVYETSMRQNGYLMSQIAFKYELGEPPATILEPPQHYRALTPAIVQAAAKEYLNTSRYVKVTLFPEK